MVGFVNQSEDTVDYKMAVTATWENPWDFLSQGLLILGLWTTVYLVLNLDFPGHPNGKWWPLYIPEHYGARCSQYLFDPYRLVHSFVIKNIFVNFVYLYTREGPN